MTDTPGPWLAAAAPWLLDPALGVCVVGSCALRAACARAGIPGPPTADLDLAWNLDVAAGRALLEAHGVALKTTDANQRRGTVAAKIAGARIEITTFRRVADAPPAPTLEDRIVADLAGRDMTVGALAHWLAEDRILDPFDGLAHWREGHIAPVGDPAARIREHPIRWLRYYRRAHQWGFTLDDAIRHVPLAPDIVAAEPAETVGAELRAGLLQCASPGDFLRDLCACGLLDVIAPEIATQFDGRPAGPLHHHPEGSQANHMVLALAWIVAHTQALTERDRLAAAVAVLCHDLGKGLTPAAKLPAHHGHEETGIAPLRTFLARYPVLTDPAGKRLAETVCLLHLQIRKLAELRAGTRAKLYARHFRDKNFRVDLFALAVGADSGGRLNRAAEGERVARQVQAGVEWMRERCAAVDAARLFAEHGADKERFQAELHQAWARALAGTPGEGAPPSRRRSDRPGS